MKKTPEFTWNKKQENDEKHMTYKMLKKSQNET